MNAIAAKKQQSCIYTNSHNYTMHIDYFEDSLTILNIYIIEC